MLSGLLHGSLMAGLAQSAIAATLAFAVAVLARSQAIFLVRETSRALGRGITQIVLVGLILAVMLKGPPVYALGALVLMIAAAGPIAAGRARAVPGGRVAAAIGIAVGAGVVIIVMTATGVLPFTIGAVVAVGSMITNNAMNASAQTLERFAADVLAHRGEVEAALALGAAPPRTVLAYVRSAVGGSMIPSINSMSSLGIVWIPGVMAGMLLTGVDPLYAAVYQFAVVAMMYSAAGLSSLTTAHVVRSRVFSAAEQLLLRPGGAHAA